MAKLQAPLFSTRAKGKFGNIIVFQQRPVGSVAYADNQTHHGNSAKQQYNRFVMRQIRSAWSRLTPQQKAHWNAAARQNTRCFGYHLFISCYMANVHRPFDIPVTLSCETE